MEAFSAVFNTELDKIRKHVTETIQEMSGQEQVNIVLSEPENTRLPYKYSDSNNPTNLQNHLQIMAADALFQHNLRVLLMSLSDDDINPVYVNTISRGSIHVTA